MMDSDQVMRRTSVMLLAGWALAFAIGNVARAGEEIVFQDRFEAKLGDGWTWLRENSDHWQITGEGLEIRVEPGDGNSVRNALLRKAPDRRKETFAIEVTVTFTVPPTRQFEQAGLVWYQRGKPVFKLVHELVDGKPCMIPGKIPAPENTVRLRLVVSENKYTAQYRPEGKAEFQTISRGPLPPGTDEQVSLQCYHGPADVEHWMRFSDFQIIRLMDGEISEAQ